MNQISESSPAPDAPLPGAPLLEVRDLSCERDERVLFAGLSFVVDCGTVLQIAGSNGSGKTTLLRILCGLNDGYDGEIIWRGESTDDTAESFVGDLLYFGHRVGVNKILTPLENLRWSAGMQRTVNDQLLLDALAAVGLQGFEESPCYTLSAGQQQRVSLARLRLSSATLWVLDEPFTTLDVDAVAQLEQTLADHARQGGAVIVTTHHKLTMPSLSRLTLGMS